MSPGTIGPGKQQLNLPLKTTDALSLSQSIKSVATYCIEKFFALLASFLRGIINSMCKKRRGKSPGVVFWNPSPRTQSPPMAPSTLSSWRDLDWRPTRFSRPGHDAVHGSQHRQHVLLEANLALHLSQKRKDGIALNLGIDYDRHHPIFDSAGILLSVRC